MMQINWTLITCLTVGLFVWAGFGRGWWKEAVTTVFLALLIFLLQQPDLAQQIITWVNGLLTTIWNILPASVITIINDTLQGVFGISSSGAAIQLNAGDAGTWIFILIVVLAISTFIGRFAFNNTPTLLGRLLGVLIGGFNGFIVLSLAREYLDGRALPGSTAASAVSEAGVTVAGTSSFGSASSTLSIQATNLPNVTILDSVLPWVLIALGLLLAFAVLKTKVAFERNKEGGSRINYKRTPPFYGPPPR